MAEKRHFVVIDSNSVIHRAFHALPPLTNKKGERVSAVYGFLLVFLKIIREIQPFFIAACFDSPGPTFRHEKFKEYKAQRPPAPDELISQIPKTKEIIGLFNVPIFEKRGFEADDIVSTIVNLISKDKKASSVKIIIVSGDRDTFQLIGPKTEVYFLKRGVKDTLLYDEALVKKEYQGLTPGQLLDWKALRGDPSDNVPGARGIGEKTATSLIRDFRNLKNLYSALERGGASQTINKAIQEKLIEQKEQVFLSKELLALKEDVSIGFNLQQCGWRNYNKEKVIRGLKELDFYSLVEKLPGLAKEEKIEENLRLW